MRNFQRGLALAVGAAGLVWGQEVKRTAMPRVHPTDGPAMFEAYCAACHGAGGKGDGPAATALKKKPLDLTEISARNNGEFPALMVMTVLGNTPGASSTPHGTADMPLWGEVFRTSGESAAIAQTRIYSLVRHLQSIQRPVVRTTKIRAVPPERMDVTDVHPSSGEQMFKSYCASCHGLDARGGGPAAASLTTAAPDLTKLARDNNGKFPEARVISMLGLQAGPRTMPAHGTKTMPVWGDVFRAGREDQSRVQLRIANLAKYVESIQRQ